MRPSSPPRAHRCRWTRSARRSSSSRATTSSVRSPATSANCCRPMPASRSRAMAAPGKPPRCSRAVPKATTPWCSSTACASIPAPSAAPRCRTSRQNLSSASRSSRGHAPRCMAPMPSAAWSSCSLAARRRMAQARAPRSAAIPRSRCLATWRCRPASNSSSASAAVTPRARACRRSSMTTVDRGYRNVTARGFAEFAATERSSFARAAGSATGRTEYSEQTFSDPPYAPVSQDFENSVYSVEGEYRVDDGLGVRATVSRALDDIDQLQADFGPAEFDYARTQRTNVDVQVDLASVGTHALQLRHAAQRRKHARAILRHGVRRGHARDAGLHAGSVRDRPRELATRSGLRGSRNLRQRSSPGTPNSAPGFGSGTRITLTRRQGVPCARQHRPVRFRRQSGPRPGSVAAGRVLRAPEVRRSPATVAVRVRQSHRRPHRLRDHRLQHIRRAEPEHRARAHQGSGTRVPVHRRSLARCAPSSRCRTRVTKPPTNACCAVHANR